MAWPKKQDELGLDDGETGQTGMRTVTVAMLKGIDIGAYA